MAKGLTKERKHKEQDLLLQLNKHCSQEEIIRKQKSRVKWLQEGDRNTTFFHRSTIQHRMNNRISKLKIEAGEIL